jgi:putative FmdB family regulatory protein
MPSYAYVCQECGEVFEFRNSGAGFPLGIEPECPMCQARNVVRGFMPPDVVDSPRGAPGPASGCGPVGSGCCCGRRRQS